ncbi:MAG: hypothetical protein R6V40_04060 [Candidatus Moraniibacteriota bacterium]
MKAGKFINFFRGRAVFNSLYKKSWILTIFFFVVVLGFSIQVWRDCVLNPELSKEDVSEISKDKENYEKKISKIEEITEKIKERQKIFRNKEVEIRASRDFFKKDQIRESESKEADNSSEKSNLEVVQ